MREPLEHTILNDPKEKYPFHVLLVLWECESGLEILATWLKQERNSSFLSPGNNSNLITLSLSPLFLSLSHFHVISIWLSVPYHEIILRISKKTFKSYPDIFPTKPAGAMFLPSLGSWVIFRLLSFFAGWNI